MTRARLGRILWIGAAAILVVVALIGVAAVVGGNFSSTDWKILLTLGALLLAGATGFAGLSLVERNMAIALGRVSVTVAACGFVLVDSVDELVTRNAVEGDVALDASDVSRGEQLVLRRRAR